MATLTSRQLAQSTAITPTTLIHIVYTGDISQSPDGSSYKAELQQLSSIFSGGSSSFTGGTVNGPTNFTSGLTSDTISATTYQNLPISGLTEGTNINISGSNGNFTISVTGLTSGSDFTGGTVTGSTTFTNGLSANTISATTYQNLPISGTNNYLSKFSSGSTILVDSQIRDNGSTVGLGAAPNSNAKLFITTSSEIYGIIGLNDISSGIGIIGQANGLGDISGVFGLANGIGNINIGVNSQANEATTNIGLKGYAFNGVNNYGIQLIDGTEGVGKVLTSMTSDGKSNWQTLPVSGLTAGSNISLTNNSGNYTIEVTGVTGGGSSVDPYYDSGSGSTITWNVSGQSTNYQATLTAATTLNLTNVRNGDYGTIILKQDTGGSRTISLGTINGVSGVGLHKVGNGGGGSIVLTSNANAEDILTFTYTGSKMYWTVGNDYT